MFEGLPILSIITFFPLVGALALAIVARVSGAEGRAQLEVNAPRVALLISGFVFLLALIMTFDFDNAQAGFQFMEDTPWLGGGIEYRVGVDGISVLFVLLTAFLTPLCILASDTAIKDRKLEYMIAFLILETLMIGVFVALDLVLFYLFFEAVLLPMFIIIGVWGG
ncbi:MAG: NADH-quinone oxidoreductase subunit M, partial [Litorimonas sp.]